MRVLACELHANRSAVFGPDQMTGLDFQRIQEACDVGGEFAGAPAVPGRLGRGAEARQVETNDTVLVRQMRHPRDPGARGFGVAMHHHDGLGNHLVHGVAPTCFPAVRVPLTRTGPPICKPTKTSSNVTALVPNMFVNRSRACRPQISGRTMRRNVWSFAPVCADGKANRWSGCADGLPTG